MQPRRVSKEEWIERARAVHGNKYDYSLVEYSNLKTKVKIICPIHGITLQSPQGHLYGGCRKCGREICSNNTRKSLQTLIEQASKVHNNKYDYSLIGKTYKNNRSKVNVICPNHGPFLVKVFNHVISQTGCPRCSGRITQEEWIARARIVHKDRYSYDNIKFRGSEKKIDILCEKHGEYSQAPFSHLQGHGCPSCNLSTGEIKIYNFLQSLGIPFEPQKTFDDCRGVKRPLPFDFYISSINLIIEFQGKQHFTSDCWGGCTGLKERQRLDSIKKKYCQEKGLRLLEIRYDEDIIQKLSEVLPEAKNARK